jgi:hypothetical protein
MKKSEEYRQQAQEAEHVLASLGLHTKALREERMERFKEKYLPLLEKKAMIAINEGQGRVTINNGKFGVIDYYPKANKILIRKQNKWIKPGLQWLVKNLIQN